MPPWHCGEQSSWQGGRVNTPPWVQAAPEWQRGRRGRAPGRRIPCPAAASAAPAAGMPSGAWNQSCSKAHLESHQCGVPQQQRHNCVTCMPLCCDAQTDILSGCTGAAAAIRCMARGEQFWCCMCCQPCCPQQQLHTVCMCRCTTSRGTQSSCRCGRNTTMVRACLHACFPRRCSVLLPTHVCVSSGYTA